MAELCVDKAIVMHVYVVPKTKKAIAGEEMPIVLLNAIPKVVNIKTATVVLYGIDSVVCVVSKKGGGFAIYI